MVGAKIGGRPKNAWTSSRKRKLVRLYSLTTLDKDEIRQVLKDHDFDPCSSDIQKKLRELFPRDYSKEYRRYRPSGDSQMASRLSAIKPVSRGSSTGKNNAISLQRSIVRVSDFKGPETAFRNNSLSQPDTLPIVSTGHLDIRGAEKVNPQLLLLDGSSISQLQNSAGETSPPKAVPGASAKYSQPNSAVEMQKEQNGIISRTFCHNGVRSL
ncbi:hypothetical protein ONS95_007119 [Cadophora gregata]|uniref:uncharacterized protein n=1 Tax=Cadophora gregata TaxID=51156 RepID=UPI0026DC8CCB|nr:uncharacterized protein ONS95_007119 [Cadophora gregata]KAK0100667.1 hypothetical protein ONS95_007119 [Cadophora gregata]KAK0117335.1 hypothetical protein ONS96_013168 [Cadophora gregata f. sp. sojae]